MLHSESFGHVQLSTGVAEANMMLGLARSARSLQTAWIFGCARAKTICYLQTQPKIPAPPKISMKSTEFDYNSRSVSRETFIYEALPLMRNTRGRELPGTYNRHLIVDLFFEQSQ